MQTYIFFVFVTFIFISSQLIKTNWFKGIWGEFKINLFISLLLNKKQYHLIKDVTLYVGKGTTQIDHIIVSVYGIFVIETKNYKGWIFGGEHQKTWTEVFYKNKNKFQNPLHQNYKHEMTLKFLLEIEKEKLKPIVVFIGNSEFKTKMPINVIQGGFRLIKYIKSQKEILFSQEEVEFIINKINKERLIRSFKTNREHIKYVNSINN